VAATRGTSAPPLEHRRLRLSWTAALAIVATVIGLLVARGVFVAAHRPLSWAAAAVVAAALLDPLVDHLARRIGRPAAVLLIFLVIGGAAVGTTYTVFDEVESAINLLEEAGPEAAKSVEERSDRIGRVARDARLERRVTDFVAALEDRTTGGDDVLRSTAGTAPTYFVSAIFTVFFMTYGPRIASGALKQDRDENRRRRVADLVDHSINRARRAVVWTVALAVAYGLGVAGTGALLDLPAPTALGFSAFVMGLLPHVGVLVGAMPLLLVAIGFESGALAVVLAVVVVALQAADSLWIRTWIGRRSVHIGLLAPWVVALVGYAVYGIGGAAYSLAVTVFVLALLDRLHETGDGAPGAEEPQDEPFLTHPA